MIEIQADARHAAQEALLQNAVGELRRLRVDESAGQLRLSGNVRTYYHKQLAQEAVRTAAAGTPVINQVVVN